MSEERDADLGNAEAYWCVAEEARGGAEDGGEARGARRAAHEPVRLDRLRLSDLRIFEKEAGGAVNGTDSPLATHSLRRNPA